MQNIPQRQNAIQRETLPLFVYYSFAELTLDRADFSITMSTDSCHLTSPDLAGADHILFYQRFSSENVTRLLKALEIESSLGMDLCCSRSLSKLTIRSRGWGVSSERVLNHCSQRKSLCLERNLDFLQLRFLEPRVPEMAISLCIVYRPFLLALTGPDWVFCSLELFRKSDCNPCIALMSLVDVFFKGH
jgi:hypothetical protein